MTTKSKTWLNPDGSPKTVGELRGISKGWSNKQWEDYAQSLEVPQREKTLGEATDIEHFSNEKNAFSPERKERSRLKQVMIEEVKKLSGEKKRLIHLLFVKNLTLSQAAKELGVCKTTVMRNRNRLLKNLQLTALQRTYAINMEKFLKEIAA